MKEYAFTLDEIVKLYKRYVMRCPTRKVIRHTGRIDDVPKDDYEINNAARVWYRQFKNREKHKI
jgi:hypothetical protein